MPSTDNNATLNKTELEAVLDYIYSIAEDALENGSREQLRETLSEISDICDPDSELAVDVEKTTVEVTGWSNDDESDQSAEDDEE